jgi:hypothetical protein
MKVGAEARAMARIEGEVQRYQFGPDGDEWVKADAYAALCDYEALIEMERDALRDEVERLRAAYTEARDMVLNDRGPLAEAQMDSAQTNAVLAVLDDAFRFRAPTGTSPSGEASHDR